jgi:cell wall-active antibiotic response 4TMS protein YvqF
MGIEAKERHKRATAAVFGVLLIGLGVIFLLQNLGVVDAGRPGDWWPVILIGFGISSLVAPKDPGDAATGVAVAALGAFFLMRNFDVIDWRLQDIWPAFLVLAGISLIARSIAERRSVPPAPNGSLENGGPR